MRKVGPALVAVPECAPETARPPGATLQNSVAKQRRRNFRPATIMPLNLAPFSFDNERPRASPRCAASAQPTQSDNRPGRTMPARQTLRGKRATYPELPSPQFTEEAGRPSIINYRSGKSIQNITVSGNWDDRTGKRTRPIHPMDRYTVHEFKSTTAANGWSAWSGFSPPVRAPALLGGGRPSPHIRPSLAEPLPSVSCCTGITVSSYPGSIASTRSEYTSARRGSTTACYRRTTNDACASSRSIHSGTRDIVCCHSTRKGERHLSPIGRKINEISQINSSRRHPIQGESGRLSALFSTTRSRSKS